MSKEKTKSEIKENEKMTNRSPIRGKTRKGPRGKR